jgi:hypothetical protein
MRAKEPVGGTKEHAGEENAASQPLLMVDIDGVISLFGGWGGGA